MRQRGSSTTSRCCSPWAWPFGMAKKEKEEWAALSRRHRLPGHRTTAICAMINASGGVEAMAANTTTSVLGITSLQMGVFRRHHRGPGRGGLCTTAFTRRSCPRCSPSSEVPALCPIVCTCGLPLLVGIADDSMSGRMVASTGIGLLGQPGHQLGLRGHLHLRPDRACPDPLRPLHHVFYMPFWQTAVGGTCRHRRGSPSRARRTSSLPSWLPRRVTEFSVDATRFMGRQVPA